MREAQRKMELHSTWAKVLEKVSISPSFLPPGSEKENNPAGCGLCTTAGGLYPGRDNHTPGSSPFQGLRNPPATPPTHPITFRPVKCALEEEQCLLHSLAQAPSFCRASDVRCDLEVSKKLRVGKLLSREVAGERLQSILSRDRG